MCNERDFDAEWKARMRHDAYIRARLEAVHAAEEAAAIERARRALEDSRLKQEEEELKRWLDEQKRRPRRNTM